MMMVVEQWFGVHSGETIGRGLLAQILRDCQITREEFKSLL
jgi:predicted RNA binding protein YcfA (HicA-like mRNA interferase family)